MLVITRKEHERIRIGSDITITVVRIGDNRVRIGIDAPISLRVSREDEHGNGPSTDGR